MTIDFQRETETETKNEMDAVLQAGRVLMESGAEIYRIEDTMGHMAKSLGIRDFSTYVVNRGVMISGLNRSGLKESRVLATSVPSIHLGKLEEVNRLSRELAEQPNQPVSSIFQKLKTIEQKTFYRPLEDITACVIGAGSFSLALGSSWIDGTAAAISGVFVGIGMQLFSRFIHTSFLQIILSSAIAALSANILYYLGIGQHRSVIILGTLMILIPGAYFVNAIREFTQNNYYSGLALMLSGVSTCLSISVGVLAMISILPFAEQLSGMFSTPSTSWLGVSIQTFMAGLGTAAFSVLYRVPKKYFLDLGTLGAGSWLLYLLIWNNTHHEVLAILFPALLVTITSRFLAHYRRCPATVFLASSMFPLIPGMSFYRAVYFLLIGNADLGLSFLRACFLASFTIAIAVSLTQQIPSRYFVVGKKK